MKSKILLALVFALIVVFTTSAISASDNITDSQILSLDDSTDSESVNSNTLSTNNDSVSLTENTKNQTELTAVSSSIYYNESYKLTLIDSNTNNTLANKSVSLKINNVNYNTTTDSEGIASVNITLASAKYSLSASFRGDSQYGASNLTSTIEVLNTIKANNITKYYKSATQYSAVFFDSQGNVLANTNVTITVSGKLYTKKTNSNGVVTLSLDLQSGDYSIVATNPVTAEKLTTTFKILPTISASNIEKVAGDSTKFTAKFLKSNGKALASTYINFKLNGKTYKVKTNTNGKASISLKSLNKGTYKIVCYNTDGSSRTFKIKVYDKVSTKLSTSYYTFLKSDSKVIKVTLYSGLGKTLSSGRIIKISINGKTYAKKTNSKGRAYLKLPNLKNGIYTVKYVFGGATHYKSSSASNKVAVIPTKNPTLKVKSTTTFGKGAGTLFKVAATSGSVVLANKNVVFTVNKNSYSKKTDNNGIASLPIKLEIGNYTVKYELKDSDLNTKSGSSNIKVVERTDTNLVWKSASSFTDSSQKFKVLLSDGSGKALSGKTIKLTINSKTYTATTASNGYATFKTSVGIGVYNVSVKYAGSNSYVSSATSKSVSVTTTNLLKGINEKNTISDLSAYLKSSKNCEVGNSKIKSLVSSLTSGLTSDLDKATAIFNYVRDTLSYNFYYNTKYGAVGTLNAKKGNCVDHTHLLVAMFRTADLAARYVHGNCKFTSGNTYGHVWAQVLIGDTWVCADATSSKNSLGKINNWNTKTYTLKSQTASLSF